MREGPFHPRHFWIGFCQLIFIKNFQTFLEVKIDINRVNLLLGGAKDEHFSCFLSSCQLGLV